MEMNRGNCTEQPKLPRSRLGKVSTWIASVAFLLLIVVLLMTVHIMPAGPEADNRDIYLVLVQMAVIGIALCCFVGMGFGMLGLREKEQDVTLAKVGLIASILLLIVIVLLTV